MKQSISIIRFAELKISVTIQLLLLMFSFAKAVIIDVPADFPTIQGGINGANNGDTVLVQPGTYFENINLNGKDITLASLLFITGDTTYISATIINGNNIGPGVLIQSGESANCVFMGFTVTNCIGAIKVENSSPTISNIRVVGNTASTGAGITFTNSSSLFENSLISNNTCTSTSASGLSIGEFTANMIVRNIIITNNQTPRFGGGVYIASGNGITPTFINLFVANNRADKGGGVLVGNNGAFPVPSPVFINCIVVNNTSVDNGAYGRGGGVCVEAGAIPIFINCTIANNHAVYGGAFYSESSNATVINCILWGNDAGTSGDQIFLYTGGTVTVSYSDVQGSWAGAGNISTNPQFVAPTIGTGWGFDGLSGDWSLQGASPCHNTGNPDTTGLNLPFSDYAGNNRVSEDSIDMGAYEIQEAVVSLSGVILTEAGTPVPGVTVTLSGDDFQTYITGTNGRYSFTVVGGGNYTITPSKNNDVVVNNGISSLDNLLMRRHILGIGALGSPYKIIAAAEANADGDTNVSTLDILRTRELILGNSTGFPTNRLWQFVSSDYVFPDASNPFPFDKTRTYTNITSNQTGQDFIGIKIGDVNESWDAGVP